MNTIAWVLQGILALIFLFLGFNKSYFSEKQLVQKGQTGVEGLPLGLIRFIGISEILGAFGMILPQWLNIYPTLTPIAIILMGLIMIPAAIIHFKRNEMKNVITNILILVVSLGLAYYHFSTKLL